MKRRIAFIIMLVLCFSTGIAACILVNQPDVLPAASTVSAPPKQATLSAPKGAVETAEEEKKEAVLPTLPELSQPNDISTSSESAEVSGSVESASEPRYSYTASHSSQRLFIRNGDSMRAKIIGSLQPGESGEVISIGETWVLLKHNDIEGYVFKEYLDITEIPQSEDLPES